MNIERVTYRRLKNTGNYNNVTVELTALVDAHEDPKEVYFKLVELADELLDPRPAAKPADAEDLPF